MRTSVPVVLHYQGKNLTLKSPKLGGKNQSGFDGFYVCEETGEEFFIKVPGDKKELFTELLAGKIITAMIENGLIDPKYRDLLICADAIQLPDGRYGLIQPAKKFTEIWKYFKTRTDEKSGSVLTSLWKLFTTAISGTGDRDVLDEMLYGQTHYYPLLEDLKATDSLAACLLYSLIVGDYSVHSANVVCFGLENGNNGAKSFGRIDWGAAFRNFGRPNNQDVMNPLEYHSYKGWTKGYHLFYLLVKGLFKEMSAQADSLKLKLKEKEKHSPDFLKKVVGEAFNALPPGLLAQEGFLTKEDRVGIANYIGMERFLATGDDSAANKNFSDELAVVMSRRIESLSNLPKTAPELMEAGEHSKEDLAPTESERLTPRLAPNKMFDFAFSKIYSSQSEVGRAVNVELIEPSASSTVYGARFTCDGQAIVLTSPAADDDQRNHKNAGTSPLSEVLANIRTLQNHNDVNTTFLVPLGECQQFSNWSSYYRQHWTMLMIQGDNCYFFDPCSDALWPTWFPGQVSGSAFYSLDPLKQILDKNKFRLNDDLIYLGWQKVGDSVNCGRYGSAIAEKIAEFIFSKQSSGTIPTYLKNGQEPTAAELVAESAYCMSDRRVVGVRSICDARRQEFLNNTVTHTDLRDSAAHSSNGTLTEMVKNGCFVQGDGLSPDNFQKSVSLRKNMTVQNNLYIPASEHEESTLISFLKKNLGCDEDTINKIIAAESNASIEFLPRMIVDGIKRVDESSQLAVGDGQDVRIDLSKKDDHILMKYTYPGISLKLRDSGLPAGDIEEPIDVSYQLEESQGRWGWKLVDIKTENVDVLRILNGGLLDERYWLNHYCPLSQASSSSLSSSPSLINSYIASASTKNKTESSSSSSSSSSSPAAPSNKPGEQVQQLAADLDRSRKECEQLQVRVRELEEVQRRQAEENDQWKSSVQFRQGQVRGLKTENTSLCTEVTTVQQSNAQRDRELHAVQTDLAQSKQRIQELANVNATTQKQNNELVTANVTLQQQKTELTNINRQQAGRVTILDNENQRLKRARLAEIQAYKIPKWEYAVAVVFLALGVAALATGFGAFAGGVLIGLVVSGALTTFCSGAYLGYAAVHNKRVDESMRAVASDNNRAVLPSAEPDRAADSSATSTSSSSLVNNDASFFSPVPGSGTVENSAAASASSSSSSTSSPRPSPSSSSAAQ